MGTAESWLESVRAILDASAEGSGSATIDPWDGSVIVTVSPESVLTIARTLRDQLHVTYVRDVAGIDEGDQLIVVYLLTQMELNQDVRLRVPVTPPQYEMPSLTPLWPGLDWGEREVYDLLGVHFIGHPNLVRIMMPDDWVGHPLRKDYVAHDPEV